MSISVEKLLAKMEEELKQAKNAPKQESLREKVYSIKILCELILDESKDSTAGEWSKVQVNQPVVLQQPISIPQPKKLDADDDANGDSLFDF
ncbi:YwdI family protein [Neobacillus mesonae]|uniref:YwdI family protein n=1 Tax=Neobacillus mesonae TaxID=1193713 RepID=UPI00203DFBF9|nr:YwdI family protein [Neobacillus mesonae]MCM3567139.1 YwdI family protein [Neobacillus mesonae]